MGSAISSDRPAALGAPAHEHAHAHARAHDARAHGAEPRVWQRSVPLDRLPLRTPAVVALAAFGAVTTLLMAVRMVMPLAPFSGMSDAYPWGVWKTFNVMTLSALGSGGLALGVIAWVFDRKALHVIMRPALVTSFLLYATGLAALGVDVGRPWNFWNVLVPTHWNVHSALLEVAVAMPTYCMVFLLFENVPLVLERFWYTGSARTRAHLRRAQPWVDRLYPWMVAGAYLLPMGHQSSLGALLLLAGPKLDPLWQTQWLPLLYLGQAFITGASFVLALLLASCAVWRLAIDRAVLGELARWIGGLSLGWLALRAFDLAWRGQLAPAFARAAAGDGHALVFWLETACVLAPALLFQTARWRAEPRRLFLGALVAIAGGMLYRFVPTTIAFDPGHGKTYFPNVLELLISAGFIAIAALGWVLAVRWFAVLPAPLAEWHAMLARDRVRFPHIRRDRHGNPSDD